VSFVGKGVGNGSHEGISGVFPAKGPEPQKEKNRVLKEMGRFLHDEVDNIDLIGRQIRARRKEKNKGHPEDDGDETGKFSGHRSILISSMTEIQ